MLGNDIGMPLDPSFDEQIAAGFLRARENPEFRLNRWWLTFYLTATPSLLEAVAKRLLPMGGENLKDTESGWLYAKVPSYPEVRAIRATALQVAAACDLYDVWVSSIDVDTSAEVGSSHFEELYRSETSPSD